MDTVRQHQRSLAKDALQNERIEIRMMLARKIGPDRIEPIAEIRPEIGRRHHAGQDHRDAATVQFVQHRRHIGTRLRRIELAQHVITAKAQQNEVRLRLHPVEREGQAPSPVGAGIAGDTGIHHRRIDALPAQPSLNRIGKALTALQAIARVKAVAKGEDDPLGSGHRHGRGRRRGRH